MSVLHELRNRFNTIPTKILGGFPVKIDKLILRFIIDIKGPRIDKTILKKSGKVKDLHYLISRFIIKVK